MAACSIIHITYNKSFLIEREIGTINLLIMYIIYRIISRSTRNQAMRN